MLRFDLERALLRGDLTVADFGGPTLARYSDALGATLELGVCELVSCPQSVGPGHSLATSRDKCNAERSRSSSRTVVLPLVPIVPPKRECVCPLKEFTNA